MNLISKKDFSALFNKQSNYLSNYIKRGQIVLVDGMIDLDNEVNSDFLLSRQEQMEDRGESVQKKRNVHKKKNPPKPPKKKPAPAKKTANLRPIAVEGAETEEEAADQASLSRKIKLADLKKKELESEISQRKLDKELGKSLPTEIVREVVSQMNKSFVDSFKEAVDNYTAEIVHRHRMSADDHAELKKALIKIVNKYSVSSVQRAKRRIEKVIKEMKGEY